MSFIPVSRVCRKSVMPVEWFVCFAEQNALSRGEDVWLCICGCICVVFDNNNSMPALLTFLVRILTYIIINCIA